MVSMTAITVSTTGTVIWYDHWEDGYEVDITKAEMATTTVWGGWKRHQRLRSWNHLHRRE